MTVPAHPRLRHKRPLRRKGVRMLQVALPSGRVMIADLGGIRCHGLAISQQRDIGTRTAHVHREDVALTSRSG